MDVQVDIQSAQLSASAAHDGYRHLPGKPRHDRAIHVAENASLQVCDRISGAGEHHVQAGWLLAPFWSATPITNGWLLTCDQTSVRVTIDSNEPLKLSIVHADYHPEYGKEITTQRIQWDYQGSLPLEVRCTVGNQEER